MTMNEETNSQNKKHTQKSPICKIKLQQKFHAIYILEKKWQSEDFH